MSFGGEGGVRYLTSPHDDGLACHEYPPLTPPVGRFAVEKIDCACGAV